MLFMVGSFRPALGYRTRGLYRNRDGEWRRRGGGRLAPWRKATARWTLNLHLRAHFDDAVGWDAEEARGGERDGLHGDEDVRLPAA